MQNFTRKKQNRPGSIDRSILKRYLDAKAATVSEREKKMAAAISKFRDGDPHKAAMDVLRMPKFLLFADYDFMSGNVAIEDLLRRKATNNPKEIKPGEKVFFAFLVWSELASKT